MPKVTVRRCPFTRKVFFGDDEYKEHLFALRQTMKENRHARELKNAVLGRLRNAREKIATIDGIRRFVHENATDIVLASTLCKAGHRQAAEEVKIETFNMTVSYSERCSNSHRCPHNGVKNFSRTDDKPLGYPGFRGEISWTGTTLPAERRETFGMISFADALTMFGLQTGSGGGGFETGRYQVTLFLDDFPALKARTEELIKQYDVEFFKAKLSGTRTPTVTSYIDAQMNRIFNEDKELA